MSLRRRIFYLLIIVGFLFVIVNIHQRAIWVQQTFRTESRGIIPGMKISSSERSGQKISTATNSNHANNRKDVENEIENDDDENGGSLIQVTTKKKNFFSGRE